MFDLWLVLILPLKPAILDIPPNDFIVIGLLLGVSLVGPFKVGFLDRTHLGELFDSFLDEVVLVEASCFGKAWILEKDLWLVEIHFR